MQQVKLFIYLAVISGSALFCQYSTMEGSLPWVVVSSLLLSLIETDSAFLRQGVAVAVTGLAMMAVMTVSILLSAYPIASVPYVVLVTLIVMVLAPLRPRLATSLSLLPIIAISSLFLPKATLVSNLLGIGYGIAIVSCARIIFWPHFLRHAIRSCVLRALRQFALLSKETFACFIDSAYQDSHYLYERRLHIQKNLCMATLNRLSILEKIAQDRLSKTDDAHLVVLINQCRFIYDNLVACAALRWRVKDHATFELLQRELTLALNEITALFSDMEKMFSHKNPLLNTEGLVKAIRLIEQNYQHVVQVAEKDPIVFQIFITNLSALAEEIKRFFIAGTSKEVGFIYD